MHRSGSQVAGFSLESADLEGALFSAAYPRALDSAVAGDGILDVSRSAETRAASDVS